MSDLFANVVGNVAVEFVAAASLAAASVAVAAVYTGCHAGDSRKRKPAAVSVDAALPPPLKMPRRQPSPEPTGGHASHAHAHAGSHGATFTTEVVVDELKRKAVGKWRSKVIYTFLDDRGLETVNYTYEDIDRAARRIAATLQTDGNVQKGDRVMLCYPPGLDFALGFWGCLYAGAIGIPVYPPYPGTLAKDLPKFNRMVDDSGARVILTNKTYHLASKMATVKGFFSTDKSAATTWPPNVQWFSTDAISDSVASLYDDSLLRLTLDDLAFFQYSSGSTSAPKAVMISHGNLRAQLKTWDSIERTDTLVSWLPSYHDMGLVGFIITPCMTGAQCVSMSPISFIKDPAMWMRIASRYSATHVCAPNFGYALAARKTSDAAAAAMDLSTLKQTICAAEPIRRESLDAFTTKFKAAGFNPQTFNCGYGLAEVTLVCTGQDPLVRKLPTVLTINKQIVERERRVVVCGPKEPLGNVMTLVGCGKAMPTFNVIVVDPDSKQQVPVGHVGELWVEGPSVAVGYWNRPEYTEEMFGAQLAPFEAPGSATKKKKKTKSSSSSALDHNNHAPVYLRTGDLGFLDANHEVFVTGRLKDLIIIRGRNVVPQDVEASIEKAHAHIRPGCTAAFSIEKNDEEALVLVAEVQNNTTPAMCQDVCRSIVQVVLAEHQLRCEGIVLLRQKAIPKTTSGKIQRSAAKAAYIANAFMKPLYVYKSKDASPIVAPKENDVAVVQAAVVNATKNPEVEREAATPVTQSTDAIKTEAEILAWLVERIAKEADAMDDETDASNSTERTIDPATPWAAYGLDSIAIVGLSSELGEFLNCIVPPSAFFQFDSPLKLSQAPGLATGDMETDDDFSVANNNNATLAATVDAIDASCYKFEAFPEVQGLKAQMAEFEAAGLRVPFLETLTPATRALVNFNTYNYLGNASDAVVAAASTQAIVDYGTTMSSSPIVGQTQINVDLEAALCSFFQADASILFVGGWVANVATIDALVSKGDLILCDALNHNSCVTGQRLSGATILPFPHNDMQALERMLTQLRTKYRRVLIIAEGVYSMDGDIPDLQALVALKKRFKAILFLDEAHSFGTMGATGRGLVEHCGVDPRDVDVRMGTMSKALGSVGGFILGSTDVIRYLKHCAGGFVFSVGLSPACAGAALQSLTLMAAGSSRTQLLQQRSAFFYDLCVKAHLTIPDTTFRGAPVVVVVIGSTIATAKASEYLATHGRVNVKPIVYPAVEEGKCRLRFFISALHTTAQLEQAVKCLSAYLVELQRANVNAMTAAEAPTNGVALLTTKTKTTTTKTTVVNDDDVRATMTTTTSKTTTSKTTSLAALSTTSSGSKKKRHKKKKAVPIKGKH